MKERKKQKQREEMEEKGDLGGEGGESKVELESSVFVAKDRVRVIFGVGNEEELRGNEVSFRKEQFVVPVSDGEDLCESKEFELVEHELLGRIFINK